MSEPFDAIVIGAGQSGGFLAARLADAGWKTALIEREHLGGTCVNDGCTPTKTLVASARAAWSARHAAEFGVVLEGAVKVDMKAVKARKDKVVGALVKGLSDWFGGLQNLRAGLGFSPFRFAHGNLGQRPDPFRAQDFPQSRCHRQHSRLAGP